MPLRASSSSAASLLPEVLEPHGGQDLRRLGELDVAVLDHLDVVAPGVDEVEPAAGQDLGARLLERLAQRRPVVDHQAEVPVRVRGWVRPAASAMN